MFLFECALSALFRGYNVRWFECSFLFNFRISFFVCFVVAIFDLMQDVEAIHGIC